MGRVSDTRNKVRALALAWYREGKELSPTAIREALGTGSATTIVDELRRVKSEIAEREQLEGIHHGADPSEQDDTPASATKEAAQQFVPDKAYDLTVELGKAIARFDSMQKRLHQEIDECREDAKFWRAHAEKVQADTKREVERLQAALSAQSELCAVLKDRLARAETAK